MDKPYAALAVRQPPDKANRWWILQPLADPDALPILRYWLAANGYGKRDELESLIARLEQERTASSGQDSL